ncbi:NADPH:quinone reductase-like Zn-dependent oxidoreductase [Curtobacterium sp. PhB191]|uniref:zinc-binding alcohol dehydrogenase family protein n=1 Tax=Curtobacterium sp. PhB191 TaxID=2485202 RepID=UPI001052467E|nr:zinc-binding alcohol dehydrogenase family protein [Curtobacterium sp. PhB191]TCU83083.1 NADPH:quinone reductase-like Zn-dependent oxidoreductase [Curtobacterium sp. PhB191]
MTATMRAVVIDAPGGPEVLRLREVPVPTPAPGLVLIRVEAFGLNRSELHFRRGMGHFGSFPRVPGIEAVGTVVAAPGGEYAVGTQVAALMGGMGRDHDGGYAEYTLVPASSVVPFTSTLDWATIGAVPEMLQTAHGSLTVGVDAQPGDTLLVRGGTSSVGLACIVLAKQRGMTVIATSRNPDRTERLRRAGADHVVIDTGSIADEVRRIVPAGVDGAVELIGTDTLPDTLRATAVHGTVSFTGMLSDVWTIPDFYPMDVIPNGVRLTAYSGGASDLPVPVLQGFLDSVAAGTATVPIAKVYPLEDIVQAHRDMEDGARSGKLVVTTR